MRLIAHQPSPTDQTTRRLRPGADLVDAGHHAGHARLELSQQLDAGDLPALPGSPRWRHRRSPRWRCPPRARARPGRRRRPSRPARSPDHGEHLDTGERCAELDRARGSSTTPAIAAPALFTSRELDQVDASDPAGDRTAERGHSAPSSPSGPPATSAAPPVTAAARSLVDQYASVRRSRTARCMPTCHARIRGHDFHRDRTARGAPQWSRACPPPKPPP